jgi:hypothetical protein
MVTNLPLRSLTYDKHSALQLLQPAAAAAARSNQLLLPAQLQAAPIAAAA